MVSTPGDTQVCAAGTGCASRAGSNRCKVVSVPITCPAPGEDAELHPRTSGGAARLPRAARAPPAVSRFGLFETAARKTEAAQFWDLLSAFFQG